MTDTIAVITPSYNQGQYIERTIQSVLSQNIDPIEYVIIDGGSQDNTLAILKRYSHKIKFVSEPDRGQAHAVNKGIMMTKGNIIGWLNSDDIYYPNAIQTILDYFAQHPEVDILYGDANHIDQSDHVIAPYPTQTWDKEKLKQFCFISQPAVFFRRRVIEQYGLLNEKLQFCMDYEYWLRLSLKGVRFAYLPQVLAGSRLYPETKTLSEPLKAQQEAIKMLKDRLGYVPENWILNDAITRVKNKTALRMPSYRYQSAVFLTSLATSFQFNGFRKGLKFCFTLPRIMLARRK